MAIKGEVHVKSMIWAPKISLNDGRYVIRPFECKIIGQAEGLARVKASIHTFFATFDDEEWRIITLFVNHLDSQLKYTDLFAASCGSLGEFTDIKQSEEGYAMTRQMKLFNFLVRNLDGTFYAQVHPFDPSFFAVKVHPSGVLLFTPHHSQLTLLQHIILQAPFLKKPVQFLDDNPKYWLEDDGTMCLHPSHRWKSDDTIFFFLRLPIGQYGPVSQLSRSEESCTGPFNWGEAHCAGEKVKRKIGPFLRKSLKNQTRTRTQQKGRSPPRQPGTPWPGSQVHGPTRKQTQQARDFTNKS